MIHSYMVVTTTFELEPVLDDYIKRYPRGQHEGYQIVFRTENEHAEAEFSYIVVFKRYTGMKESHVDFDEFLKSYCKVNNCAAIASETSHILPKFGMGPKYGPGRGRLFGTPPERKG